MPNNEIQQNKLTFHTKTEKDTCDQFLFKLIDRYKLEIESSDPLQCKQKLYNYNRYIIIIMDGEIFASYITTIPKCDTHNINVMQKLKDMLY